MCANSDDDAAAAAGVRFMAFRVLCHCFHRALQIMISLFDKTGIPSSTPLLLLLLMLVMNFQGHTRVDLISDFPYLHDCKSNNNWLLISVVWARVRHYLEEKELGAQGPDQNGKTCTLNERPKGGKKLENVCRTDDD